MLKLVVCVFIAVAKSILLSELFEHGKIISAAKNGDSPFHIINLNCVKNRLFIVTEKEDVNEIRMLKKKSELGIGGNNVHLQIELEGLSDIDVKENLSDFPVLGHRETNNGHTVRLYVVEATRKFNSKIKRPSPIEERNTLLMATLWDNIFRVLYATSSIFLSLDQFGVLPNNLVIIDFPNNADYSPLEGIPRVNDSKMRFKIMPMFGEYINVFTEKQERKGLENKTYRNAYCGNPRIAKLDEFEENKIRTYDSTKRQTKGWGIIRKKAAKSLKRSHEEGRYKILHILRSERDIMNPEVVEYVFKNVGAKYEKNIDFMVEDFSRIPVDEQFDLVYNCDLLIAHHGAALGHIVNLREGTNILEIFPYKFIKYIYKNLARGLDVNYFYWRNTHPEFAFKEGGVTMDTSIPFNIWDTKSKEHYRNQNTLIKDVGEFEEIAEDIFNPFGI